MSTQLYVLLEGPLGTWGPGSSDTGQCSSSQSHSVVPPSTQSQGSVLCLHLQPPPQCHCRHQWRSFSPIKENNLFEIRFFWRQDTTPELRAEPTFLPVLHRSRMRWKQDILNNARMTLFVCIHARHSLKTQTQHPSLQRWRQEELKGPRGIWSAGLPLPSLAAQSPCWRFPLRSPQSENLQRAESCRRMDTQLSQSFTFKWIVA